MSTRKAPENASGSKGLKPWMKNLIFAAVILVLAAALYFGVRAAHSSKGSGLQATVDFGDGITETLPLDTDHDYLYDMGNYVVHLQVKDGAIAFLDSQCPDHVCEQFGWLDKDGAWAACVPAGVYVVVETTAESRSCFKKEAVPCKSGALSLLFCLEGKRGHGVKVG